LVLGKEMLNGLADLAFEFRGQQSPETLDVEQYDSAINHWLRVHLDILPENEWGGLQRTSRAIWGRCVDGNQLKVVFQVPFASASRCRPLTIQLLDRSVRVSLSEASERLGRVRKLGF
jgi:hypothetical protein